ncbi:MAG: hypothetical protein ACR5LB_07430 [Wolbachia sp.]
MKEGDLVGIVLQARMVAKIFQDECRKYLKSEKFNPYEFRINNILTCTKGLLSINMTGILQKR